MNPWFESLINLVLPLTCAVCGKALVKGEETVCTTCLPQFPETGFQTCLKDNLLYNRWPEEPKPDGLFALWNFTPYGPVQSLLHSLKYQNRPDAGIWAGKVLGSVIAEELPHFKCEAISFVPLHPKRLKERGYNQAEKIAEGMAQVLGIPTLPKLLQRGRYTETQTRKDRENRLKNMKEAMQVNREQTKPSSVLLVDDVITTGATLAACHGALTQAGIKKVCIVAPAWAQTG